MTLDQKLSWTSAIPRDKLDTFNSLFHQILDQHAPVKIIKQRARPNSFINDKIRSLMRTGDYWQWLARQINDSASWSGYRNFKREVKREIRLAQREFVEEQLKQNPTDVGNIWKTIRSWIPKKACEYYEFYLRRSNRCKWIQPIFKRKTEEHWSITLCTSMVRKLSFSEIPGSPYKLCFIW